MERKKRLALNTSTSLLYQIVTIICGFILPRLILKSFGSEVNGLVNSITQFLAIISFLELGVGAVIQSSLYKPLAEKNDEQISRVIVSGQKFFSKLAKILLAYVIILMTSYPFIANQKFGFVYTATMIGVISISSFAQYYFGIINSLLLTADQKGYVSYISQTVTLIMNTVACFMLIKRGAGIHLVKLVTSLIYAIRPLILAIYVKRHYNLNWNIKYTEEPIKQKWNGVAQHISAVVLDGTDNIVLTIFSNLKDVSVYSVYNIVTAGVKQLMLSMTNGIQALIGELWAKQEINKLREFFGWVEWSIHTCTVFVFGITSIMIIPFVEIYTKGISDVNYIQPVFAMLIVIANAGHCLRLPYNVMILAGGHYKQTQMNYVITATINVIISVLSVKIWGLIGVAIGTVIAMFYQTIWMAWYDSRNLICWPFIKFLKQILVDVIIILILYSCIKIPILKKWLEIKKLSYYFWVIQAIKVTVIAALICIVVNTIFYFSYMKYIGKYWIGNMLRNGKGE